jgi:hypothetical protein
MHRIHTYIQKEVPILSLELAVSPIVRIFLERFPMDCAQSLVLILPFRDPHLLEGVQRGEDRAADPGGVEALLRRADPDLDVLGREFLHLGEQAIAEAFEEGGAARKNNVLEQNLA